MLLGHIYVWSLTAYHGWSWLVPFMISFGPFYNGWLFWLCNSTQHVGLDHGNFDDNKIVNDFRRTTRTFYVGNPLVQFWYWHMNYHTEHHMYAHVPCYNLAALHKAIKHELPPTPNGLLEVWNVIAQDVDRQQRDPSYVERVQLPKAPTKTNNAGAKATESPQQ